MSSVIKLHFTKSLMAAAVRSYWRQTIGLVTPIVYLILATYACYLVINGDRSWVVGALFTILVFAAVMCATLYIAHMRRAMETSRRLGTQPVTVELSDTAISFSSPLGNASLSWSEFSRISRYETFWLLHFVRGSFTTLPLESIDMVDLQFIADRIGKQGT
jgi:hypothetical protein